jgi:hypothetical protein
MVPIRNGIKILSAQDLTHRLLIILANSSSYQFWHIRYRSFDCGFVSIICRYSELSNFPFNFGEFEVCYNPTLIYLDLTAVIHNL